MEFYRAYFGPVGCAFEALPPDEQLALRRDLEALWSEHNTAEGGTTCLDSEYLEVMAKRR